MTIRPEHERRAHVEAYASEIKFKLCVMLTIWILVFLTGCSTVKPYAELSLGMQINENSDYWVQTDRSWQANDNVQFNGEVGVELPNGWSIGYHHQSWLLSGGPFNNEPEVYQDDIRITKKFGGYK